MLWASYLCDGQTSPPSFSIKLLSLSLSKINMMQRKVKWSRRTTENNTLAKQKSKINWLLFFPTVNIYNKLASTTLWFTRFAFFHTFIKVHHPPTMLSPFHSSSERILHHRGGILLTNIIRVKMERMSRKMCKGIKKSSG